MRLEQWLLGIHVLGAFCFVSGAILAGVLQTAAVRRDRASEIAFLLGLTRVAVALVGLGALVVLGFGAWLVDRTDARWGDAWIVAALCLWVVSLVLGAVGGRRARHARRLAERLAGAGDVSSTALRRELTDRASLALNYGSFLAVLAVLGLMVWKP